MANRESKKAEVAEMTARGLKTREIALVLQISTQAVSKHQRAIARERGSQPVSEQSGAAS